MEERPRRKRIRNLNPANLRRARRLRRSMTVSEQFLWSFIRKKQMGFLFRTQHPVGDYFLDFYCSEAKLCIEVDGEQHRFKRVRDAERDQVLAGLGIFTLRIPSTDLFQKLGGNVSPWLEQIVALCEERSGRQVKLY